MPDYEAMYRAETENSVELWDEGRQLARGLLSIAQLAMPDSYWYSDSRVKHACRKLGIDRADAYEVDWQEEYSKFTEDYE